LHGNNNIAPSNLLFVKYPEHKHFQLMKALHEVFPLEILPFFMAEEGAKKISKAFSKGTRKNLKKHGMRNFLAVLFYFCKSLAFQGFLIMLVKFFFWEI